MPAVFVHGVPDTERMWRPLLRALDRKHVVCLGLPGFGTDVPDGWTATKEEYAEWLERELSSIGEPVDLVAHDWGAILAQRLASTRPDLVRTLACGGGPLDTTYEWHAMAQAWQTPGMGEEIMDAMAALVPDDLAAGMVAIGTSPELAANQAECFDATMARQILALYRSAVTVGAQWQPDVDAMPHRPSLVFHGADDPYVDVHIAERLARRLGAELIVFPECGHWWPWDRTEPTAAALTRLWA